MIELTNNGTQVVPSGAVVTYNTETIKSGCAEKHVVGSGTITLALAGRYLVTFTGNVAIPTTGTAGEIDLAMEQNGEMIIGGQMKARPTAVNYFYNVAKQHYIDVPKTCAGVVPQTVSIINNGDEAITVDNPTFTVVRVNG